MPESWETVAFERDELKAVVTLLLSGVVVPPDQNNTVGRALLAKAQVEKFLAFQAGGTVAGLRAVAKDVAAEPGPVLFPRYEASEGEAIARACTSIIYGGNVETDDLADLIHYIADMME